MIKERKEVFLWGVVVLDKDKMSDLAREHRVAYSGRSTDTPSLVLTEKSSNLPTFAATVAELLKGSSDQVSLLVEDLSSLDVP